jgi:hypothetical protein
MKMFLKSIYFIYLNKFRKFTYGDSSKFYILLLIYLISVYQIGFGKLVFGKYILLILVIFQSISETSRNDFTILKKNLGISKTYLVFVFDLVLFNTIALIALANQSLKYFTIAALCVFLFPFFLFFKRASSKIWLPFSTKSPLWLITIRQKPWLLFILFFGYYIQYEALMVSNFNLFLVACNLIPIYLLVMYQEQNEKFLFFKFIGFSKTQYLLNDFKNNVKNVLFLLLPTLILMFIFQFYSIEKLVLIVLTSIFSVSLKYIFYDNSLLKSILSMMLLAISIACQITLNCFSAISILLLINLILFKISNHNFKTLIKNYKS